MKGYLRPGDVFMVTAGADIPAGEGVVSGNRFGVAITDIANGATGACQRTGVVNLAKTSANTFAVGAAVYWDNSTKKVTSTASGNRNIGTAEVAAGSGVLFLEVYLDAVSRANEA